jgi:hypothetical protein
MHTKYKILLLLFILFTQNAIAQYNDFIFTKSDTIECKIKSENLLYIFYSLPKFKTTNNIAKSNINKIVYADGRFKEFNKNNRNDTFQLLINKQLVEVSFEPEYSRNMNQIAVVTDIAESENNVYKLDYNINKIILNFASMASIMHVPKIRITLFDAPEKPADLLGYIPLANTVVNAQAYSFIKPDSAELNTLVQQKKKNTCIAFVKYMETRNRFKKGKLNKEFFIDSIKNTTYGVIFNGSFNKTNTIMQCNLISIKDNIIEFYTNTAGDLYNYKLKIE